MDAAWHIKITKELAGRLGFSTEDTMSILHGVTLPDRDRKRFPERIYHTPFLPGARRMRRTIRAELETAIQLLTQGDREKSLEHLGCGFHAMQDLASHKSLFHTIFMHAQGRKFFAKFGLRIRDIDDYETMPSRDRERLEREMRKYLEAFLEAEMTIKSKTEQL